VNDEDQLNSNLLRSPCAWPESPHEVLLYRGMASAAQGLAAGVRDASNSLVVFVQQDVYLPYGWDRRFSEQLMRARERYGPIGVAGVFGLSVENGQRELAGCAMDRDTLLRSGTDLPSAVDSLDEIVLAVDKASGLGEMADPELKFHLYGTDLCLSAKRMGLTNVTLDAAVYHNSLFAELDRSFFDAADYLLAKWPEVRPLHSSMGELQSMQAPTHDGPVHSAEDSHSADAHDDLAVLRQQLEATEARLSAVLNSRTWRWRAAIDRRVRGRS
jgi:hypothetical protein